MNPRDLKKVLGSNNRSAFDRSRTQQPVGSVQLPPSTIRDSTGREVAKGHVFHIPTNSIPNPVLICEVVDIKPASVLATDRPPQPAMVIVAMHMVIPVNPDGSLPCCYIVGKNVQPPTEQQMKEAAEQQQEDKADGHDALHPEDSDAKGPTH